MRDKIQKLCQHLCQEHKGVGGLFLILVSVVCAGTMYITFELSYDSRAVAIADNIAQIEAINVAVDYYVGIAQASDNYEESILKNFNSTLKDMRLITDIGDGSENVIISPSPDGETYSVQFGPFTTEVTGSLIRPHVQEASIEND